MAHLFFLKFGHKLKYQSQKSNQIFNDMPLHGLCEQSNGFGRLRMPQPQAFFFQPLFLEGITRTFFFPSSHGPSTKMIRLKVYYMKSMPNIETNFIIICILAFM